MFDDIPNIVNNPAVTQPTFNWSVLSGATSSGFAGPFKRPIAYASFALNSAMANGISNTLPFKLTNVLIHLFNAILVYLLAARVLRSAQPVGINSNQDRHRWIAVLAAAMWALHPLQTTPVLHVVQRMASLTASFMLLGTLVFLEGRELLNTRPRKGWGLMWSGLGIGLLLGLLTKENAALMPFLLFTIEYTIYSGKRGQLQEHSRLRRFYFAICGIPLLAAVVWLIVHPNFISTTYELRDFGPVERLLTQARVLWFYLGLLAIPDFTRLGLFHDDFQLSTGILDPWTTIPAIIGLSLLAVAAVMFRRRTPLLSLAILWFLVGHGIESTIIGLELVHEHRNYLPDVMLFVALSHGLAQAFHRDVVAKLVCLTLVLTYGSITFLQARTWSEDGLLIESMVRNHPESASSQAMMAELLAYRRYDLKQALLHYRTAIQLAPNDTTLPIQMMLAVVRFPLIVNPGRTHPTASDRAMFVNSALPDITALSDGITSNLGKKYPSGPTFEAIDSTVNCIADEPTRCRDLYPHVLRWCQAILDNPNLRQDARLFAADCMRRLTAWNKKYKSSLEPHAR